MIYLQYQTNEGSDVMVDEKIDTTENVNQILENNENDTNIEPTENANYSFNNLSEPNCLALTVRKDYNLIIVKNIFTSTGRLSWKVALATAILNIINLLF